MARLMLIVVDRAARADVEVLLRQRGDRRSGADSRRGAIRRIDGVRSGSAARAAC